MRGRMRPPRHPVIEFRIRGRRLDVEPYPIDQRENFLQAFRNHAAGMKAHGKAQRLHLPHGIGKRWIDRGFAARKYNAVEKSLAALQERLKLFPGIVL